MLRLPLLRQEHDASLEGFEEGDQIDLLLIIQPDVEPGVVEVDDKLDLPGSAGVEIRRTRRQTTENRRLKFADVGDITADHRPSRVGGYHIGQVGPARPCRRIAGGSQTVLWERLHALHYGLEFGVTGRDEPV